jgi:DNA helicase-2/ATP-dependent DNA helicase PcrA
MSKFIPSPYQQAVFDHIASSKRSARIEAVAGSGKTTTILHATQFMGSDSVAMVAYNRKISEELKVRLKEMGIGPNVRAGTFHSFGNSMWFKVAGKVELNDKKLYDIADSMKVPDNLRSFVTKLVSLAKQRAIGVEVSVNDYTAWQQIVDHFDLEETLGDGQSNLLDTQEMVESGISFAMQMLAISTELCKKVIDFDDMIYAPLIYDVKAWQYDRVLIDEAQDTNPARRMLAKKMLKVGGQLVAVGDPHQAIYGFTGADNNAFDLLATEFGCVSLPLTVSYRCPKSVVRHAQQFVDHIQAFDASPEGSVTTMDQSVFKKLGADALNSDAAILCRNTKPLVELAYHFIRKNIPAHVEGRDIGKGLINLMNKWRTTSVSALMTKLDEYLVRETERFLAKGQEAKAEALRDKVETLGVIADCLPDMMRNHIAQLFEDTPDGQKSRTLTLSTVHKSKGREWPRVYLYGRNKFMPSPFARQQWQMDQEVNLMYVAVTRAKAELIEVVA